MESFFFFHFLCCADKEGREVILALNGNQCLMGVQALEWLTLAEETE